MSENEISLKYGCNPHQKPARIYINKGVLPVQIINGNPGYINFMDALNSWQLVKELRKTLNLPAAASFKHVSPAGAAVASTLPYELKHSYFVGDMALSQLAVAYARARGADRISSYGDWIALSDKVDSSTAMLIKREVSDGVIAPGYSDEALAILKTKRNGGYNILQMDADYEPEEAEPRTIYGVTFEQGRNNVEINEDLVQNIVTANKRLPESAMHDMLLAMITLKYTQSNSVCYTLNGQVIGVGAGQQSRIHCTRLAGDKADLWCLRQSQKVLRLPFKEDATRTQRDIAIDQYLNDKTTPEEMAGWGEVFQTIPERMTEEERAAQLAKLQNVTVGSDAYFPQRDNIDRARKSGVRFIVQPGGSMRDEDVIAACDENDMIMVFTNTRLFHH